MPMRKSCLCLWGALTIYVTTMLLASRAPAAEALLLGIHPYLAASELHTRFPPLPTT